MNDISELKNRLIEAFENDSITLLDIHQSYLTSVKRKYGVEGLYFWREQQNFASPKWCCSTREDDACSGMSGTEPHDIAKFLKSISYKKGSFAIPHRTITFVNTGKTYKYLDELKEDYLTIKLAKI